MNLKEYQAKALETAVYNGRGGPVGFVYCVSKLTGEAGELAEKMVLLGDGEPVIEEIVKELGDIMWYVAATSDELGSEIPYYMRSSSYYWASISIAAARVSEMLGKEIRDNNFLAKNFNAITENNRLRTLDNLSMIVASVETIAQSLGVTLKEVCEINIEKLASRAARGTLHGSGDNR